MNNDVFAFYWPQNIIFCPIWCYPQDFFENQSNHFSQPDSFRDPSEPKEQSSISENNILAPSEPQENLVLREVALPTQKKKKVDEYAPKSGSKLTNMKKKKYKRDADRNILPNIVNKLYSFVGCKSRCKQFVGKFIACNPQVGEHCTVNKFFFYHKQLRSSLNKFLLQEDLVHLFQIHKKLLFCFSEQEQKCFIKINIFMLHLYYRNNYHVTSVVNSCRISRTKIEDYLKYFQVTKQKIEELSNCANPQNRNRIPSLDY